MNGCHVKNSNIQIPNNSQYPNINDPNKVVLSFGIWDLRFIWNLDIGIWKFRGKHGCRKVYQKREGRDP